MNFLILYNFYDSPLFSNRLSTQVAINPLYTESELEFSLKKVGAKGVIIPKQYKKQNYYNMMMNIAPELENCKPGNLKSAKLPNLKLLVVLENEKLPYVKSNYFL